jgi:MFS family permease
VRLTLLALTTFAPYLSTLVGTPVIPTLVAELGADPGAMAATLSSALVTVVLLQCFTGSLADRHGRRLVLRNTVLADGLALLELTRLSRWLGGLIGFANEILAQGDKPTQRCSFRR